MDDLQLCAGRYVLADVVLRSIIQLERREFLELHCKSSENRD